MDVSARKTQKAGREKLRREKLNEHFVELGHVLGKECGFNIYMIQTHILSLSHVHLLFTDPDRPKNDKATILTDTVQLLKELSSEVNKLKSEYTALTDESREVLIYISPYSLSLSGVIPITLVLLYNNVGTFFLV